MGRVALFLFLILPALVNAQRGVDFRQWPDKTKFSETQIREHLTKMRKHNIEEVSIDGALDLALWKKVADEAEIKLQTGNQRFGKTWLSQCRLLPSGDVDTSNCVRGLIDGDMDRSDELIQLAKDYQPIQFSWAGEKLTIHRVSDHYELKDLKYEWRLLADGKAIESGWFSVDEDSLRSKLVDLNMKTAVHDKQFHHLELSAKTKAESGATPADHEVAKEQFELSAIKKKPLQVASHSKLETSDRKDQYELAGANFQYVIERNTGLISSIEVNGVEQLASPIKPVFHFAGEDISAHGDWKKWEEKMTVSDFIVEAETPYLVKLTVLLDLGKYEEALKIRYQIFSTGDIRYTQHLALADTLIAVPRFGMLIDFAEELDSLNWFGRGPHSNFQNANSAAFVGAYQLNAEELSGVRTEIRWANLGVADQHIFLAGEPNFTMVVSENNMSEVGIFTTNGSAKTIGKPTELVGQEQKLRMRLRPFESQKETAWKLSRFTVREMRPPLPKAMESRKHEVVK